MVGQMGEWEMVRLGDVCDILDHMRVPVTASDRTKGIYPYYGANGVQDYVDDYIFDDELVLLAEDGGHFGSRENPIAYRVSGKCWINNHAHVLKPKNNLNVDYLCYSIMFYDVMPLISGTTRAKLNQAAVRKMTIPLPPLPVQRKIAETLDLATALIEKRKAQIAKLDLLVKSQFVTMFGDPVTNPMGWDAREIQEICATIVDCPHSTPKYTKTDTGYMCIRTTIVKPNLILWSDIEFIEKSEFLERTKRKKPSRGDVIYTREGAILGIAAVIDVDCDVALGQRSMLLSPNAELCNPQYLSHTMNMDSFSQKARTSTTGSASPHINVGDVKKFIVPIPPLALQTQFAAFVEHVEKQKVKLKQGLELMALEYKALMQRCFWGSMFAEEEKTK